jgi:hypothetical protein
MAILTAGQGAARCRKASRPCLPVRRPRSAAGRAYQCHCYQVVCPLCFLSSTALPTSKRLIRRGVAVPQQQQPCAYAWNQARLDRSRCFGAVRRRGRGTDRRDGLTSDLPGTAQLPSRVLVAVSSMRRQRRRLCVLPAIFFFCDDVLPAIWLRKISRAHLHQ